MTHVSAVTQRVANSFSTVVRRWCLAALLAVLGAFAVAVTAAAVADSAGPADRAAPPVRVTVLLMSDDSPLAAADACAGSAASATDYASCATGAGSGSSAAADAPQFPGPAWIGDGVS